MEDYAYHEAREFIYNGFVKICRAQPATESFFTCLGIETMKSFIRVKNSSFAETGWENLKKIINDLKSIAHENSDEESTDLIFQFCMYLENCDIEAGLFNLKQYTENNNYFLLNHLTNCMRAIYYGYFSKNILIEVTQKDLDRLSQKLKVYIAIYSNNEVIQSQTSEFLPAVYLYQGEENDNVYYGNLIHERFFDITNDTQISDNEIPFVNYYIRSSELDYRNTVMNEDGNKLIKYILQILIKKDLPEECVKNILEAAEEENYNDEYIEKLSEKRNGYEFNVDYLTDVSCDIKCKECNNILKETFPFKIHCDSGSLCIKCIIDNYRKTKSLVCMLCHRTYRENEIKFIKSF
ncbi:hypothetical protein SteCoe_26317 [Stentor coeruleus]|uniref:Uncharacterized protein n=1 Tax=Stentor coeruleus TaxID=5963 RepID=A0A1R2BD63_9CILI|nr:hypothetical protein SteCoe_26317 [Stentor coeruleus]